MLWCGVVCEIEELHCTVAFRQALAEMLKINRTMTHLNLQCCCIRVKGIKAQRIDFVLGGSGDAFEPVSKAVACVADDVFKTLILIYLYSHV